MPVINAISYKVTIGPQGFKSISSFLTKGRYSSYVILCDENTLQNCLPPLIARCPELGQAEIVEIEPGEVSKSLELCAQIWHTLLEQRADKNTLLINLGGGVVSDLGGFLASVYKRGIDFIHIPTSLLAMADASIGGKTGIDFAGIKNSIGTFTQPKAVFVIPEFLNTLPQRHYRNGLAEVVKIALVRDKTFWMELQRGQLSMASMITKSIMLKNDIVQRDPFDRGLRKILNFGHSIGHAIEALLLGTPQELLHGEAIVAGMLAESHLAWQKKMISKTLLNEISAVFQQQFDLPSLAGINADALLDYMANDKKTTGKQLLLALIDGPGSCRVDVSATGAQVKKALHYYNTLRA